MDSDVGHNARTTQFLRQIYRLLRTVDSITLESPRTVQFAVPRSFALALVTERKQRCKPVMWRVLAELDSIMALPGNYKMNRDYLFS